MVTFAFRCNIACTFCMVEDVLGVFEGTSLDTFRKLESDPSALGGAKRIIFSGGEVTLAKDLLEYAAVARRLPGVEHVRLQTNAMRLKDRGYVRSLIDAGIDEYFVSFHAASPELYDRLAQRRGVLPAILQGMENIRAEGATLITNTAIVEDNHRELAAIVERVAPLSPRSMEFWNYWPRGDEQGARAQAARITDIRGPLLAALEAAVQRGIPPVVKWFPRCLLGAYAWCQDDGQPPALIEDEYWAREPEYGCLYAGTCDAGKVCSGLSDPYVMRFGWEETLLQPIRAEARRRDESKRADSIDVRRSLVADAGPRRNRQAAAARWLAALGLAARGEVGGWQAASAERTEDGSAVVLRFTRGTHELAIDIRASDPQRTCAARTKSFDLCVAAPDPAFEAVGGQLARALASHIARRDPGGLELPQERPARA